jgi:hypothetical protein
MIAEQYTHCVNQAQKREQQQHVKHAVGTYAKLRKEHERKRFAAALLACVQSGADVPVAIATVILCAV